MKLIALLILCAAALACAEPPRNDFSKDAEVADSGLIPVLQMPAIYDKLLRDGAVEIVGKIAEILPPGRRNGMIGSFVVVDRFRLMGGVTGERQGLLTIFIHGLSSLPVGQAIAGTIYPCPGRRYAVSPLSAYAKCFDYQDPTRLQWPPAAVVRDDRKHWLGEPPVAGPK